MFRKTLQEVKCFFGKFRRQKINKKEYSYIKNPWYRIIVIGNGGLIKEKEGVFLSLSLPPPLEQFRRSVANANETIFVVNMLITVS